MELIILFRNLTSGVELRIAEVFEPTCPICGLTSGYQGDGSITVLPARASAKVDFRLVPDQTPEGVVKSLRAHLDQEGYSDVKVKFLGGEKPARTDPDDPFVKLVCETAIPVYGKEMKLIPLSGGSGPNSPFVHDLGRVMGLMNPVMMPLVVLGSPFAGWSYDVSGDYLLACGVFAAALVAGLFALLRIRMPGAPA